MTLFHGESTRLKESVNTRWLSRDSVTLTLWNNLAAIIDDLQKRGDGEAEVPQGSAGGEGKADVNAKGLHSVVATMEWISFLALMRDVLPTLAM